jgi:hypothetical protein
MFAACLHVLGFCYLIFGMSAKAILKSKKSCSLAKTQPVSEPRPVPNLQGAI